MKNNLKTRVMFRVYVEFIKNIMVERIDYLMFIIFITASLATVSVQNVIQNTPKDDMSSAFNFFVVALRNTNWVLQALMAGFFARLALYGVRFVKTTNPTGWLVGKLRLKY